MEDYKIPKYLKLKEYITEAIKTGELKPGDRILSENKLAGKFKVSRHTVRHAISELVSEGWLYSRQGKGTFVRCVPSQKVKYNRTNTIGVITTYLNDYIFPAIIQGIDKVTSANGYNIMLGCTYNQHEKERNCLENLMRQDIAGMVVETTKSALPNTNLDLYNEFENMGIPVLFIHGSYKGLDSPSIVQDDEEAGNLAARHLLELGHSEIGGVFKIDDIQGHYRFAGFQKALTEAGIKPVDSRIVWYATGEVEDKIGSSDSKQLTGLLSGCSAIVCYNDMIALKIMNVIREKGMSVPGDISIVSFDDSELAVASEVKLTTVVHPKEKLGEKAGESIISMINGKKQPLSIKLTPDLVVRGSTVKLPVSGIE